jgi:hypothetical protein
VGQGTDLAETKDKDSGRITGSRLRDEEWVNWAEAAALICRASKVRPALAAGSRVTRFVDDSWLEQH